MSGVAPLTVSFTDQSTNNPTSWSWNFGDGTTSIQQSPSHTYVNPGNYTVQLTITNTHGSDTEKKTAYIQVSSGQGGETGTFTDSRDGQTYKWVKIGNQVWMAENLNFASANSWCYSNNATNCDHYGRLYNWAAVMNGASSSSANPSGVRGVCPTGWHVPSHDEWTQLEQYICNQLGNSDCATKFPYDHSTRGWRGTNEGNALKSCRQVDSPLGGACNTSDHPRWGSHSTHYGTDAFDFSALPGGRRYTNGSFYLSGDAGYWWSSTENTSADAWGRNMGRSLGTVTRSNLGKALGFSLRCVRD